MNASIKRMVELLHATNVRIFDTMKKLHEQGPNTSVQIAHILNGNGVEFNNLDELCTLLKRHYFIGGDDEKISPEELSKLLEHGVTLIGVALPPAANARRSYFR